MKPRHQPSEFENLTEKTFNDVEAKIASLLGNQQYREVAEYLDACRDDFPDFRITVDYYRACAYARLEQNEETFHILNALAADDLWLSEVLLRQSPSFQPLQGENEFEALIESHQKAFELDPNAGSKAQKITIHEPKGTAPYSTMFFMHGNGSYTEAEMYNWEPMVGKGWLVAGASSTQRMMAGRNSFWTHEYGEERLISHVKDLIDSNKSDPARIVVGGFSMGAEVALVQALKQNVPIKGFILVAPGGTHLKGEIETLKELITSSRGDHLKGAILMSEDDPLIEHSAIRLTADTLNQHNIDCQLVIYSGSGHVYPDDFDVKLDELLTFITG